MGRGDLGDSHIFQGERKGDQSSQADYKRGDYRKLTLKESGGGGGGGGGASEYYRA